MFYGIVMNLGPKALQGLCAPGKLAMSSAPSDPPERQTIVDAAKAVEDAKLASKAAAKAAAKARAKNKAYDPSRLTTLEPMLKQWGRDMRVTATKMHTKAEDLIAAIKRDHQLVSNF